MILKIVIGLERVNKNYQLNLHTIYISLIFIQCIYFLKQRDFYNNLTDAYFKLTPTVNAERYCETLQKLRSGTKHLRHSEQIARNA